MRGESKIKAVVQRKVLRKSGFNADSDGKTSTAEKKKTFEKSKK